MSDVTRHCVSCSRHVYCSQWENYLNMPEWLIFVVLVNIDLIRNTFMVSFLLPYWVSLHLFAFYFWRRRASIVTVWFAFQNSTPISLRLKLFSCYLSQYSKVQHYLYQLAFRSHFCVLFPNPATMSNVFLIPTWKFSVSNIPRVSCQANLQWILFFVQSTSVGGFFFITDHFLSSFLQLSLFWTYLIEGNGYEGRQTSKGEFFVKFFSPLLTMFWRMVVYCVCDTLVRKSSGY